MSGLPIANTPAASAGNSIASGASPAGNAVTQGGDVLADLLELRWRGIAFPSAHFTENGSQQLAVHRFPDQDSARVEPTGRMPSQFSCRAVLTNNVFPGVNETWKQGQLYPDVHNKLLKSFYEDDTQSPGLLHHPSLGDISCRVVKWDFTYAGAGPRDGTFLDIVWIETIGDKPLTVTNASNKTSYLPPSSLTNPPLSPPNISLGQFLQLLNSTISQVVSFPGNTLDALQSQNAIINGAAQGIVASLITAIPQTIAAGQDFANANKNMLVNGAIITAHDGLASGSGAGNQPPPTPNRVGAIVAFASSAPPLTAYVSASQQQSTIAGNYSPSDPAALPAVYQAAFALNNTASGNGLQFLQKTQTFLQKLIYYYQSLSNVTVSDTIVQLGLMLNQVQQAQQKLFSNNKNYQVNTYVTKTNISWPSLAKLLNQNINDLISLNPGTGQLYFIPTNTSINFYQSTR